MFKLRLENTNKKIMVITALMLLQVFAMIGFQNTQTKAVSHSGWSNYGWKGDRQAVGATNGQGRMIQSTAYKGWVGNQQGWGATTTGYSVAYSGWDYNYSYTYWNYR
jgi:hypothetical protein